MMRLSPLVGIDSHCHLSFLDDKSLTSVIRNHPKFQWILGGYDSKDWLRQLEIQNKFPGQISTGFGIHPWVVLKQNEDFLKREWELLLSQINEADIVGETGLDFFKRTQPLKKEVQMNYFKMHLDLSIEKPIVLHVVSAHGEALKTLDMFSNRKGWVHAFQGSIEMIHEYNKRGFLVSFGRGILNSKNKKILQAVKEAPKESFVLESDSPHNLEKIENPVDVFQKVLTKVAELRGVGEAELLESTTANLKRVIC